MLLPVVINAMEVHWKNPLVVTAASRLLCCLANTEGHLRANVVAAGALPAMCIALGKHSASEAVHALCDLAAEICSPRGSPNGSRRSMCDALASTGTLKAVLSAFRGQVGHQGVVTATCKVLLAYQVRHLVSSRHISPGKDLLKRSLPLVTRGKPSSPPTLPCLLSLGVFLVCQEEFGHSTDLPTQLVKALRSADTLAALDEAQRRFTTSQKIQLGAEWATGVGRARRAAEHRAEGKKVATPARMTPHSRRILQPTMQQPVGHITPL